MSESPPAELWKPAYKRVLLKLSGEAFGQAGKVGISLDETLKLSEQLRRVARMGAQVAVVVGGGNLLRGAQFSAGLTTVKQATADAMGMIATVMNGLALQDTLESLDIETRLMSAVPIQNPRDRNRGQRIRLEGEVADPSNPPSGCYFHPRCPIAQERCRVETPYLRPIGDSGRQVACHFAEDLQLNLDVMTRTSAPNTTANGAVKPATATSA